MSEPTRPLRAPTRLPLLLVLGLTAVFAGIAAYRTLNGSGPPGLAAVYPEPRPLPAIALLAQDGSRFDRSHLTGHYTLLFLGYTNCPDVCPTTLMELAGARRALASLPASLQPAVVMLSVDPLRDTPAVLARYVPHFDPTFVGVSGTDAALQAWARALGAMYAAEPAQDGAYRVDHSAALFLIDPSARLLAVYPATPSAASLAADYAHLVRTRNGTP
ncbi:MAG: SCO family protein [Pseudomonadota bacterium]